MVERIPIPVFEDEGDDETLEDVRAEAQRFLRDQGVIPIAERREKILEHVRPAEVQTELAARLEALDRNLYDFTREIEALPEIARLHELQQLGGKAKSANEVDVGGSVVGVGMPAFHSRFQHSELDAELAKMIAAKLTLSPRDTKISMLGAWFHDLGHSALSHTGDELLVAKGRPAHEARTALILRESPGIKNLVEKYFRGENSDEIIEEIIEVIEEKGMLGSLQSMLDTMSYLVVDRAMLAGAEHEGLAGRLISDIDGFDADKRLLKFSQTKLVQALLELRAAGMQLLYSQPYKLADEAKRQLLRVALNRGIITLSDIEQGSDDALMHTLQAEVQRDEGMARFRGYDLKTYRPRLTEFKSLFTVALGFSDTHEWDHRQYDTEAEVESYLMRLPPDVVAHSIITRPFDYTRKKIPLLVRDGSGYTEQTLRAEKIQLTEEDRQFSVYTPK